jgi:hypothetical protein
VSKKLHAAYALEEYATAKQALNMLHRELMDLNPSAARSLGEGMEETLTVHRLHVPMQLRKPLASTNVIESAFSIVEHVCKNVKRWHGGDHRERWVGSGLLVAQKHFRRVTGYKQIPALIRELETWAPPKARHCQAEKGVVEWVTQVPLLSTELRAFPDRNERRAAPAVFASSKETAKNRFFTIKTVRDLHRLRPGERNLGRRPYNHRSTSISPDGLEQQISKLPVAGGSSGSG